MATAERKSSTDGLLAQKSQDALELYRSRMMKELASFLALISQRIKGTFFF